MISFEKYHGTGNDFILIDDRNANYDLSQQFIHRLCDRHFGIGADGLILLRLKDGFDFEMLYYNSDGLTGSMCGNGGRCTVAFASALKIINEKANFIAFDGIHEAHILDEGIPLIKLQMKDVTQIEKGQDIILNTGSPHFVRFVENVSNTDVVSEGKKIRYNEKFKKEGININFVTIKNKELHVRTYERGVEDETLSCGTGVVASVLAARTKDLINGTECNVITRGGKLKVHFEKKWR